MSLQLSAVCHSVHSGGIDQIIEAIFVGHQVTISDKLFRILMSGGDFLSFPYHDKLAHLAALFLDWGQICFSCKVSRKRGCLQLFCYEVYDFIVVDLYTVTYRQSDTAGY